MSAHHHPIVIDRLRAEHPAGAAVARAPALLARLIPRIPGLTGIAVLTMAGVVLLGWALGVRAMQSFLPGLVTMKPNTALGLGLAAAALLSWGERGRSAPLGLVARLLGAAVIALGAATSLEYLLHVDLHIDQMLVEVTEDAARTPTPGRMALTTSLAFVLMGLSLVTIGRVSRHGHRPANWFALGVGAVGLTAMLGYAYGAIPLRGLGQGIQIALHTAVGFVLLAAGVLTYDSQARWLRTILSPGAGGVLVRRLLPIAFLGPVVLSTLRPLDAAFGGTGVAYGSATIAVATMLLFASVAWRTAERLESAESSWRRAEHERLESVVREASERDRAESERAARLVAERAVREKAEALAALDLVLDSTPVGFAFLDAQLRFVRVNRSLATTLGAPAESYRGRPASEAASQLGDFFEPLLQRALNERIRLSNEELPGPPMPKSGQRQWLASVYPVLSETGAVVGLGVMLVDETERRRLQDQLRQSQKMDAVGQLAGGVAHDFNNLLTVILGYAQLMLLDIGADDPLRTPTIEIQAAATRAASLTRQLLAFSRQQVLQPRVLQLNDTVRGIEPMLGRLVMTDVVIELVLAAELHPVLLDESQLEQVLMNLAVNARDAMPDGGTLTIRTENVDVDAHFGPAHGVDATPGAYVMLSVGDTGTGMTPEVQAQIFDPFFTTKEVGKGTGLGLATVYGIVKQSKGFIWCYSELGLGTTFRLYFPSAAGRPLRAPTPATPMRAISARREHVLLVEDDAALRVATCTFLEREGYRVSMAGGAAEAMAMLDAAESPIDLVISDVIMPNVTGGELAETLRALRPEIRVLLTSGFTHGRLRVEQVLDDEGVAFLEKPYTLDALSSAVRAVIGRGTHTAA